MANLSKWKDEYLFDVYELMKSGAKEGQVAKILGISYSTFLQWERKRKLLKIGIELGREKYRKRIKKSGGNEISEFVFNGLSKDMKKVWKRLSAAEKAKSPKETMEAILKSQSKSFRQYLFIYAMTMSGFQITRACKRIGIPIKTFQKWQKYDDDFSTLFKQIVEAKKDLCESHLLRLIKKGSEAATIYGVKTLCRDRGYVEKVNVDVNVSGQIDHNVLTFDRIRKYLSSETQVEILEAMRKVKAISNEEEDKVKHQHYLPMLQNVNPIDSEFVSSER